MDQKVQSDNMRRDLCDSGADQTLQSLRAVIFDMDGVLFDTERLSYDCWHIAAAEMGLHDVEEGIHGSIGLNKNDTRVLMHRLYGADFPFEQYIGRTRELMRQEMDNHGVPMKKGVEELLSLLRKRGLRTGLASSAARASIIRNLEQSGIRAYFDRIISGDMVEHSKPQPDIYLIACRELRVDPKDALTIEDSPNGIKSSYTAGIRTIMVPDLIAPTPGLDDMLYRRFASLTEVKEYLEASFLSDRAARP